MKNDEYREFMINKIYNYCVDYHLRHGYMPSVREICKGLDIKSTGTVCKYMQKLFARKVFVTENPGDARAFRIVK